MRKRGKWNIYINEVLKPNEMIGTKEEDNIASVWIKSIQIQKNKLWLQELKISIKYT